MPLREKMSEPIEAGQASPGPSGKSGDAARRTLAMRIAHRNRLRAERLARLRAEPQDRATVPQDPPAISREGRLTLSEPEHPMEVSTDDAGPTVAEKSGASIAQTAKPAQVMEEVPKPSPLMDAPAPSPTSSSPEIPRSVLASDTSADDTEVDAEAALEELLQALSRGPDTQQSEMPSSEPATSAEPASVLQFQRPSSPPLGEAAPMAAFLASQAEPRAAPICDLHSLQGAGPGLIWALQRAGIACLDELAQFEAPELTARLGYLGRLVPVEAWIHMARSQ